MPPHLARAFVQRIKPLFRDFPAAALFLDEGRGGVRRRAESEGLAVSHNGVAFVSFNAVRLKWSLIVQTINPAGTATMAKAANNDQKFGPAKPMPGRAIKVVKIVAGISTSKRMNLFISRSPQARSPFRHPELVSGSISQEAPTSRVDEWMLKQVQHDDEC
jgi:hypothetical protein